MIQTNKPKKKQHKANNKASSEVSANPILPQGNDLGKTKQNKSHTKKQIANNLRSIRPYELCQIVINALLVVIGFLAWRVYESQLDTTMTDERAWLRVSLVQPTTDPDFAVVITPNEPLSANIRIENVGNTAAKAIYVNACIEILDNTERIYSEWMTNCNRRIHSRGETGMLLPKDDMTPQVKKTDGKLMPLPLSVSQSDQLNHAKSSYVAIYGRVHYIDVYKIERWTQFCIPVSRGMLSQGARQCINFADEGSGDYDYTKP